MKRARLSVRRLTHTLHLPPAQSELYDGPHPAWLRDILEQLPNLQSLFVSQLPFFDHQALQTLRYRSQMREPEGENTFPSYALRLVVAAQCPNTTSTSLSEALSRLPNMVFLDLSKTMAARDTFVLSKLVDMPSLQILKLREIGLRDEDLETIAAAVKLRIRSLDLRGNALTDRSAEILLRYCFKAALEDGGSLEAITQPAVGFGLDDWPSGIARPDLKLLDDFRSDALDEHFIKQLATSTVSRLPSDDLPKSGITHLYISNNSLTLDGLRELIKSKRLFVLDAGAVNRFRKPRSSFSHQQGELGIYEKLIPLLEKYCSGNLTSLRLHYDIVAKIAAGESSPPVAFEMSPQSARVELDGTSPVYELGVSEDGPRYELYGDSTQIVITPAIGEPPELTTDERVAVPNVGPAFAPEVMEPVEVDDAPVLTATGLIYSAQAINGINTPQTPTTPEAGSRMSMDQTGTPELRIALVERQRCEFRQTLREKPHSLLPAMLPRLRTLTLTDIPCRDFTNEVVESLIRFIGYCAMEAEFARLQASAFLVGDNENTDQSRLPRIRESARDIFPLSRIVLEMGPPGSSKHIYSESTLQPVSVSYRTKSSTEDADSEALWSAQENDFSFFGDDEECGLPAREPGWHLPDPAVLSEKLIVQPEEMQSEQPASQPPNKTTDAGVDVVSALAKFRRERKMAYEDALKQGKRFVDGYWPGEVKVVRWQVRKKEIDFYGNHSERGIYR